MAIEVYTLRDPRLYYVLLDPDNGLVAEDSDWNLIQGTIEDHVLSPERLKVVIYRRTPPETIDDDYQFDRLAFYRASEMLDMVYGRGAARIQSES